MKPIDMIRLKTDLITAKVSLLRLKYVNSGYDYSHLSNADQAQVESALTDIDRELKNFSIQETIQKRYTYSCSNCGVLSRGPTKFEGSVPCERCTELGRSGIILCSPTPVDAKVPDAGDR